jgi:hypothetical protein
MDNLTFDKDDTLEFPLTDSGDPDWRPKFKLRASETAAMRLRDLPRDARKRIREPLIKTFDPALRDAYERGDYHAAEIALAEFDEALLKGAVLEYERARTAAADTGVEERLGALEAHGWLAKEQDAARLMIVAPEKLGRVDFFSLTTNQRTITRDEIRAFGRPASWSNDNSWTAQFVSDRNVREMQAEAARREREAARGLWAHNVNTDFGPQGVRQP